MAALCDAQHSTSLRLEGQSGQSGVSRETRVGCPGGSEWDVQGDQSGVSRGTTMRYAGGTRMECRGGPECGMKRDQSGVCREDLS